MIPDKYQKFLNSIIDMFEADHYQGERALGDEHNGYEYYWIDGLNPRAQALNSRFYVYRGNVFMVTPIYQDVYNEEKFTLFFFGRNFHIDQTLGTELPAYHQEGIVQRLKLGF